jgi:hypothetical protein
VADVKIDGPEETHMIFLNSLDGKKAVFECPLTDTKDWLGALSNIQLSSGSFNSCKNRKVNDQNASSSPGFFDRWRSIKQSSSPPPSDEMDLKCSSSTSRTKPHDDTVIYEQENLSSRKFKSAAKLAQWLTRRPDANSLRSEGILPQERKFIEFSLLIHRRIVNII